MQIIEDKLNADPDLQRAFNDSLRERYPEVWLQIHGIVSEHFWLGKEDETD
ncbi:hypothetical protein [Antarctobacter jejuensis]|uniref:hypothetical protein n=1 Tax=Antarctobacter jejuensis TaxID=1439938 RepID=UPI003FD0FDA4